jgi:hypothetical protein
MTRALEFLLDAFEATEGDDLECGGLYHGAHGLILYRERRFGAPSSSSPAVRQSMGGGRRSSLIPSGGLVMNREGGVRRAVAPRTSLPVSAALFYDRLGDLSPNRAFIN